MHFNFFIMRDIENLDDIKQMVDSFYDKINQDKELSYIFNDFAKVDWPKHLPIMYDFWNKIIFSEGDYRGNPFQRHLNLPIKPHHFERWVEIFVENIDAQFSGENTEEAKLRAKNIAYIFNHKLQLIKKDF